LEQKQAFQKHHKARDNNNNKMSHLKQLGRSWALLVIFHQSRRDYLIEQLF
jgi:hypothetical protein